MPQATGHGSAGTTGPDTLLIDTSGLDSIAITGTHARVGAGATWGAVQAAAAPRGLFGLAGTAPDVAVAGYTFHGGVGWLTRAYGLASSNLTAVEFIDGTGAPRRADANTDPELLWAFRGGGGLGVATVLEFDLVNVPNLHAGFVLWPASDAGSVIAAWAAAVAALGPDMSSAIGILRVPDAPHIKQALRGQRAVHLSVACRNGPAAATALFDALTHAPSPTQNTFGPCDATRLSGIHLDPPRAVPARGHGLWLTEQTPRHAVDILGAFGFGTDAPLAEIELRHVASPAPAATSSASTTGAMTTPMGAFLLHTTGAAPDPDSRARTDDANAAVADAAAPASLGYQIAAFCDGHTEALACYPPETVTRLRQLTTAVDPDRIIARARRLY